MEISNNTDVSTYHELTTEDEERPFLDVSSSSSLCFGQRELEAQKKAYQVIAEIESIQQQINSNSKKISIMIQSQNERRISLGENLKVKLPSRTNELYELAQKLMSM